MFTIHNKVRGTSLTVPVHSKHRERGSYEHDLIIAIIKQNGSTTGVGFLSTLSEQNRTKNERNRNILIKTTVTIYVKESVKPSHVLIYQYIA
jgi:hypothetical protein